MVRIQTLNSCVILDPPLSTHRETSKHSISGCLTFKKSSYSTIIETSISSEPVESESEANAYRRNTKLLNIFHETDMTIMHKRLYICLTKSRYHWLVRTAKLFSITYCTWHYQVQYLKIRNMGFKHSPCASQHETKHQHIVHTCRLPWSLEDTFLLLRVEIYLLSI